MAQRPRDPVDSPVQPQIASRCGRGESASLALPDGASPALSVYDNSIAPAQSMPPTMYLGRDLRTRGVTGGLSRPSSVAPMNSPPPFCRRQSWLIVAAGDENRSDTRAHPAMSVYHESLKAYLAPTGLVSEPRGDLTCRGDLRLEVLP